MMHSEDLEPKGWSPGPALVIGRELTMSGLISARH